MKLNEKISIVVILSLVALFLFLIIKEKRSFDSVKFVGEDMIPYKSKVMITNGCGVSGIATTFRELLLKNGYVVYSPQNEDYWTYDESIVLSLDGNMDVARDVAKSLQIKNCFMYKMEDSYESVKVVIGKDYKTILKNNEKNSED